MGDSETTKRLSAANSLQRYTLEAHESDYNGGSMEVNPEGEWVGYDDALAYASTQPRWIAVSERLPEDGNPVLTHMVDDPQWNGAWLQINSWHKGEWHELCTHGPKLIRADEKVTHWMPLPDAPEGDQR